jgi:hypothetical protein
MPEYYKEVVVDMRLVQDLLDYRYGCLKVAAVAGTRLRGIQHNQLEITLEEGGAPMKKGGASMKRGFERVVEDHYVPLIQTVEQHAIAIGVVPFRIGRIKMDVSKDEDRDNVYGKGAPDSVDELIPIIPEPSTYQLFVGIDSDGRDVVFARSLLAKDERPIYVVPSTTARGPRSSGMVQSTLHPLYVAYTSLQKMENLVLNAHMQSVAPTYIVEQVPPSDNQQQANLRMGAEGILRRGTAEAIDAVYFADQETPAIRRQGDIMTQYVSVQKGQLIDPINNIAILPMHHKMSVTQLRVADIPADMSERRATYSADVASALHVPVSFLTGAQSGALTGKQSTTASENDRFTFKLTVDELHQDLVHILKAMFRIIHDIEVSVVLPMSSFAILDDLTTLFEGGVVDEDTYKQEAARASGLHVSQVSDEPLEAKHARVRSLDLDEHQVMLKKHEVHNAKKARR